MTNTSASPQETAKRIDDAITVLLQLADISDATATMIYDDIGDNCDESVAKALKQQTNLDSVIGMLPGILDDNFAGQTNPDKFIHIIFDIESDDPEEIAVGTKISDSKDSGTAATLVKSLPSVGNAPTIYLYAMDLRPE